MFLVFRKERIDRGAQSLIRLAYIYDAYTPKEVGNLLVQDDMQMFDLQDLLPTYMHAELVPNSGGVRVVIIFHSNNLSERVRCIMQPGETIEQSNRIVDSYAVPVQGGMVFFNTDDSTSVVSIRNPQPPPLYDEYEIDMPESMDFRGYFSHVTNVPARGDVAYPGTMIRNVLGIAERGDLISFVRDTPEWRQMLWPVVEDMQLTDTPMEEEAPYDPFRRASTIFRDIAGLFDVYRYASNGSIAHTELRLSTGVIKILTVAISERHTLVVSLLTRPPNAPGMTFFNLQVLRDWDTTLPSPSHGLGLEGNSYGSFKLISFDRQKHLLVRKIKPPELRLGITDIYTDAQSIRTGAEHFVMPPEGVPFGGLYEVQIRMIRETPYIVHVLFLGNDGKVRHVQLSFSSPLQALQTRRTGIKPAQRLGYFLQ